MANAVEVINTNGTHDVVISKDAVDNVTLKGMLLSQLTVDDFKFV